MNFLSKNQIGSIYAIVSGLCYGFMGYFGIRLIDSGLSLYNMLFWRFFIATLIILLVFIPKRKMAYYIIFLKNAKLLKICRNSF